MRRRELVVAPKFRGANRRFEFHKYGQLLLGGHVCGRPSRDQTRRELVYRPLQFQKRSQLFIGAYDETLYASTIQIVRRFDIHG